jgi:hypothetical protein
MKKTFCSLFVCSAIGIASATEWDFTGSKTFTSWTTFGAVRPSGTGLVCGPESGSYAVSGIRSGPFSHSSDRSVKIRVKFGDFNVITPAPDELENGNDIYVHVAINGSRDLIWESSSAVVCLQLFYNSDNRAFWVELRGKSEGRAYAVPQALAQGSFLGEGSGDSDLSVQIELTRTKIVATVSPSVGLAQTFEVPLPEELLSLTRQPYFVQIYQQNIDRQGTGSMAIRSISIL